MIRRLLTWADAHPLISVPLALAIAAIALYLGQQADQQNAASIYWATAAGRGT